jgi:Glyoxalase-like domain
VTPHCQTDRHTRSSPLHLDVKVGRELPDTERPARIEAVGSQLVAAGASIYGQVDNEEGYWLIMQDPEGNEFCVN